MKLANLTPNRGTLWVTLLLQWKTNLPLETDGKMWLPSNCQNKKKEKKKSFP
jgi:hypothetical protein